MWRWRPPRRRLLPTTHQPLLFDVPPVWQSSAGSREHFVFQWSLISAPKYSSWKTPLTGSSCCCQDEFCFTVSVLASWTRNMLFPLTSVSGTFHLIGPALFLNMVDKAVIFPEAYAVTVSITSSLQGELPGVRDHAAGSTNPIMTPFIDCRPIFIQGPLAGWNLWPVRNRIWPFLSRWGTGPETAWVRPSFWKQEAAGQRRRCLSQTVRVLSDVPEHLLEEKLGRFLAIYASSHLMQYLHKELVFHELFSFTANLLSFIQYQDYMRTVWLFPEYI